MNRWWRDAACRDVDVRVFFPERGDAFGFSVARAICGRCPVRSECLADALSYPDSEGVWAGTTAADRRRMRGTAGQSIVRSGSRASSSASWSV